MKDGLTFILLLLGARAIGSIIGEILGNIFKKFFKF